MISLWLSDELDSTGKVITEFITEMPGKPRSSRFQDFGNLATVKLHRVCNMCNNEWMSELERQTSPILIPMIRGQSTELSPEQQHQISAWCQLKCLTLDAFYPRTYGGIQHLPPKTSHAFGQLYQPLLNSTVTLSRFIPSKANEKVRFGRYMSNLPADDVRASLDVVIVTLALGQLLLQVSIGASGDVPARQAGYSLVTRPALQCWPTFGAQHWPPVGVVVGDEFDNVAKAVVMVSQVTEFPGPPLH